MRFSIDRIEGAFAICEDGGGETISFRLKDLPPEVHEGDIIERTDKGFAIKIDETAVRRRKMAQMQKSLFERKNEKPTI